MVCVGANDLFTNLINNFVFSSIFILIVSLTDVKFEWINVWIVVV